MLEFIFDTRVQRYRYTRGTGKGQFLSKKAMEALTRRYVEELTLDIETLGNLLKEGSISVNTWMVKTTQILKKMHTQQFLLGKGGVHNTTDNDKMELTKIIQSEMHFIRRFANDILGGSVSLKQFDTRLKMYVSSTRGSYEKARHNSHRESGFLWERRIRTKSESCAECLLYANFGWQPIGTLPNPTEECSCMVNCGCFKEFSKSLENPGDSSQLLNSRFGWL